MAIEAFKLFGSIKIEAGDSRRVLASVNADARGAANSLNDLGRGGAGGFLKQLESGFKSLGASLQSAGQQIRNTGASLTAGITLPIVAAGAGIAKVGVEYENALNVLQAVTKASGDEMARAAAQAKALGADITLPATSAKDAALAMAELGKAGLSVNESIGASKGVLQLAAAGQLEEARAAEITANALNAFKLKAEDAARVADLLAATANASSAEVGDVAASFTQASASFAAAKVPIEDLTTGIGLLANAGIKGSDAGTSLKTFLERLQAPTDKAAKAMENLGVKVFDQTGKILPLTNIIGQFEKSLGGLTQQQKAQAVQTIFGADASRAANIIFGEGAKKFEEMRTAVTEAGAAQELAAAKTKGLGGAYEAFKSQLETIGITLYENLKSPIESIVRSAADGLGAVGDFLNNLAASNPIIIQVGAALLAVAAAVGPILIVIGTLVATIGGIIAGVGAFVGAIGGAAAAVGGLAPLALVVVAAFSEIIVILAAAAAGAAALYAAWTSNFGGIRDYTKQVWNTASQTVSAALTEINNFVRQIGGEVVGWWRENYPLIQKTVETVSNAVRAFLKTWFDAIRAFWISHGAEITAIVKTAWDTIKTVVSSGVSVVLGLVKTVMQIINGDWRGAWATFGQVVSTGVAAFGRVLSNLASIAVTAFAAIVKGLANAGISLITEMGRIGANMILGLANAIRNGASTVIGAVVDLATSAIQKARSVLGIQSPSREFYKIGGFVLEGFVKGLESQLPAMETSLEKMLKLLVKPEKFDKTNFIADQVNKIREALRSLRGADTELQQLNAVLADPKVARAIDKQTQAILRYGAALRDTLKQTRTRVVNPLPAEMRADPNQTRERQLSPFQLAPDSFLQQQSDPDQTRERFANGEGERIKEQRAQTDSYKQAIEGLNNEYRNMLDLTRLQAFEYELQEGSLKNLTEEQKENLRVIAGRNEQQIKLNDALEEQKRILASTTISIKQVANAFEDVFSNALTDLSGSFKQWTLRLVADFARALQQMAAQAIAAKLSAALFGGISGGASGGKSDALGGIASKALSFIGGLFGGKRALGGSVEAGKPYMVGERGMEMFTPSNSGYITPTNALRAASNEASASAGNRQANTNIRNVIVFSPDDVAGALAGAAGEKVVVTHFKNNVSAFAAELQRAQ